MWNAESPLYVGRALAAFVSNERDVRKNSGRIAVIAELAKKYGIKDQDGPKHSVRGTRFFVLSLFSFLQKWEYNWLIPDLYVPWWLVKAIVRPSPRLR